MRRASIRIAVGIVLAASTAGIQTASARTVDESLQPQFPSVTAEVDLGGIEKGVGVAASGLPGGAHTGASVEFDRKGLYENPTLTVMLDAWVYGYVTGVYFDDQGGPVSGPTVKLIHKVCDKSHGLC